MLFVAVFVVLGIIFGVTTSDYYRQDSGVEIPGLLWPDPKPLRPFATIDDDNQVFGLEQLKNRWSFVFFGYTHCPDICPLTMKTLEQAYANLAQQANDPVQIVFASVDPERDTSEQLRTYVNFFNPDFVGIGGNQQQVESFARQIGVAYFLHDKADDGSYLVDHSASVFLIDPQGRLLAIFRAPHKPGEITERFRQIQEFYSEASRENV